MTSQAVPAPDFDQPLVSADGTAARWFQRWVTAVYRRIGATQDKVDAAHATAMAAVPQTTQVVAGGGLHVGGALNSNVGLTFYADVCAVAALPTSGFSEGDFAYALDGRKPGESAGSGTGVPVWFSGGSWYGVASGAVVTS
jgi:hypothetical protein